MRTRPAARMAFALGAFMHAAHLLWSSWSLGWPVDRIEEVSSAAALLVAVLFLGVSRAVAVDLVGAFVAPLTLAALLASELLSTKAPDVGVRAAVLPVHVTAVLLASALFAVSSALAAAYLLQETQLKRKQRRVSILHRLPSLDVLDRASHGFLVAGFPLMTIGILTGLLWIGHVGHDPAGMVRQVLGYASWAFFATVLLLRSSGRWRGRRAAWGTILGFACAVMVFVTYFVRGRVGSG